MIISAILDFDSSTWAQNRLVKYSHDLFVWLWAVNRNRPMVKVDQALLMITVDCFVLEDRLKNKKLIDGKILNKNQIE